MRESTIYSLLSNNGFANSTYVFELDYLDQELDSGTENYCEPAIGELQVTGVFGNTLDAETTGMLCDNPGDSDSATYTGSYLIVGGTGVYGDASGSGGVSLGIASEATEFETVTNSSQPVYGQFQMTGNISLTTPAAKCSAVSKTSC